MKINKIGSNQYKRKYKLPLWRVLLVLTILYCLVVIYMGYSLTHRPDVISPLPDASTRIDVVYASDMPTGDIRTEIVRVFGSHSDKAFRLLECENRKLNVKAKNTNKDGSHDLGVFQINSYWHGFNKTVNNERYLFDPSINIAMAWRIYEGSGYSFNLWTCGKKLGI